MSPNGTRSSAREPTTSRPEIHLTRQTEGRWTLSDGKGVITANAQTFVEVRR
jgi:hypothetical protein